MTTPDHPPALLAAWAAHNGWPLDDVRVTHPDNCGWPYYWPMFKAGYEARGAEAAAAEAKAAEDFRGLDKQWSIRYRTDIDRAAAFRQAVADALAGLRAKLGERMQTCRDVDYEFGVSYSREELDATITALGLPPAAAESERL